MYVGRTHGLRLRVHIFNDLFYLAACCRGAEWPLSLSEERRPVRSGVFIDMWGYSMYRNNTMHAE